MDYASKFILSVEDETRFIKYFSIPSDPTKCWEWNGKFGKDYYGRFYLNKQYRTSSRIMYINYIGPLNSSKELVCHKCDNPKCINPTHLFKGSSQDNMLDCVHKNRHPLSSRDACKHGHLYTEDNTYIRYRKEKGKLRTSRVCRSCKNKK